MEFMKSCKFQRYFTWKSLKFLNNLLHNYWRNSFNPLKVMGLIKEKILETLVEVAGVEPASRNPSRSASTCVVLSII